MDLVGFKKIKNFPRYYVDKTGRIYSEKTKKILKEFSNRCGYSVVCLYNKKYKNGGYRGVHRLVAIAFIENPKQKKCVNHKDGNKRNNHVSNLEWCTHSENQIHAYKNELMSRGSKNNKKQSKYMNVSWSAWAKKWVAGITRNNKTKHLGYFKDEEEAGKAVTNYIKTLEY
jgi:hypothetical protein